MVAVAIIKQTIIILLLIQPHSNMLNRSCILLTVLTISSCLTASDAAAFVSNGRLFESPSIRPSTAAQSSTTAIPPGRGNQVPLVVSDPRVDKVANEENKITESVKAREVPRVMASNSNNNEPLSCYERAERRMQALAEKGQSLSLKYAAEITELRQKHPLDPFPLAGGQMNVQVERKAGVSAISIATTQQEEKQPVAAVAKATNPVVTRQHQPIKAVPASTSSTTTTASSSNTKSSTSILDFPTLLICFSLVVGVVIVQPDEFLAQQLTSLFQSHSTLDGPSLHVDTSQWKVSSYLILTFAI